MANRNLTSSAGKGAALTSSDHDQNMNGFNGTCEEVTGARTIDYQDHGKTLQFNSGSAVPVTLGTAASIKTAMDTGIDNFRILLKNVGAGVATITSTDNIDGVLTLVLNQNDSAILQTNDDNTSWNIVISFTSTANASIATNAADIATNVSDISDNAAAIAVNAARGHWVLVESLSDTGSIDLGTTDAIPTGTKQIKVVFSGIEVAAPSSLQVALGHTSGTYDSSGWYTGSGNGGIPASVQPSVYQRVVQQMSSTGIASGEVLFSKMSTGNIFIGTSLTQTLGDTDIFQASGSFPLTAELTSVKVYLSASTFVAGTADVYAYV